MLLADAHGRQDVLRDAYGYDDTPFISGLEADGFEVASSSSANYYYTEFSLASMFTSSYSGHAQRPPGARIREFPGPSHDRGQSGVPPASTRRL